MAEKPYHPVAQGGFWNTAQPPISKQTQQLLKTAMQESRLTSFQQRQLNDALKNGQALPVRCNPTSSAKKQSKQVVTLPKGPRVDPRKLNSGTRKLKEITSSGAYERDRYNPEPINQFKIRDKERLQNIMAFGEDVKPPTLEDLKERLRQAQESDENRRHRKDRFEELYEEVEERKSFLDRMESIGKGKEYRHIINTEISRLIREMEVIDRKRTKKLEEALREQGQDI
ncbi:DgyrCDS10623 [Dimorphilus gyrociliatus]|uniref:DgyrCDS10623 n=1 Tax=Dimorphilus gyrociliatus TaxID=2664684 RepID=A0A7I8W2R8_9ANNE|nr:DgyrCDS10623 [Dimorphilus gyrociliatus]